MYCKCKNTRTYNCNICGKPEEPISLPSEEEIEKMINIPLYGNVKKDLAKAIAKRLRGN